MHAEVLAGTQDRFLWEFCAMRIDWEMLKNLKFAETVTVNIFGGCNGSEIKG